MHVWWSTEFNILFSCLIRKRQSVGLPLNLNFLFCTKANYQSKTEQRAKIKNLLDQANRVICAIFPQVLHQAWQFFWSLSSDKNVMYISPMIMCMSETIPRRDNSFHLICVGWKCLCLVQVHEYQSATTTNMKVMVFLVASPSDCCMQWALPS